MDTSAEIRSEFGEIRSEPVCRTPVDLVGPGFLPAPRGRGRKRTWEKTPLLLKLRLSGESYDLGSGWPSADPASYRRCT